MKKLSFIVLSVLFMAACNTSTDELATPNGLSPITTRSQQPRAFHANLSGTLDLNSAPTECSGGPIALLDYFISGNATHLGNLNAGLSNLHHDNCNLDLETLLLSANVSGQLVGANGDLIYYTGNDVINVFNYLTGSGPNGPITGTWNINGGTGRFEDATGSFTISGLVDFATLSFNVVAIGNITF